MTGTATESSRELWLIYHRPVVLIPTHKPCIRTNPDDRIFATEAAKYAAIVKRSPAFTPPGSRFWSGRAAYRTSEHLSELLTARGLERQVLNAVRHAEEAQIRRCRGFHGKNHRRNQHGGPRHGHPPGAQTCRNSGVCASSPASAMIRPRRSAAFQPRRPPGRSGHRPGVCVAGGRIADAPHATPLSDLP